MIASSVDIQQLYFNKLYCSQAVEQLNIKPRNFKDLLTDEPFTRKDIITIQDPTNLDKFNLASFHHLKNNLAIVDEGNLRN